MPRMAGRRGSGLALLSGIALIGLTACGSTSAPKVAAAACAWHAERSGPRTTNDLYGLSFPDDRHGWVVGGIDFPVIRVTSDGGRVWRRQHAAGTDGLSDVSFPDDTHGWAVGVDDTVFATTDGGRHWQPERVPLGHHGNLYGVWFVDDHHGWIAGSRGVILVTTDGGRTWRAQRSPTRADLSSVRFINRDDGWIVAGDSELLHTTNAGATWTVAFRASSEHQQLLAGDFFLDASHGWVSGSQVDGEANHGVISRTTDGGRTWTTEDVKYFDDVQISALAFTDAEHGWMTGYQGELWYTDDGGENWGHRRTPREGSRLYAMEFRDATHGWAVGEAGTILACTA
jgi:photosystem II stability/assembly factor-like uncharacterized protein